MAAVLTFLEIWTYSFHWRTQAMNVSLSSECWDAWIERFFLGLGYKVGYVCVYVCVCFFYLPVVIEPWCVAWYYDMMGLFCDVILSFWQARYLPSPLLIFLDTRTYSKFNNTETKDTNWYRLPNPPVIIIFTLPGKSSSCSSEQVKMKERRKLQVHSHTRPIVFHNF